MKNVKKIAALGLSATMAMGMLPATLVSADEATGTVYYLNFKPEQADQWKELAEKYTEVFVPLAFVEVGSSAMDFIRRICLIYIIITFLSFVNSFLKAVYSVYSEREQFRDLQIQVLLVHRLFLFL